MIRRKIRERRNQRIMNDKTNHRGILIRRMNKISKSRLVIDLRRRAVDGEHETKPFVAALVIANPSWEFREQKFPQ